VVKGLVALLACLALPALGGCTWILSLEDVAPNATEAGAADAHDEAVADHVSDRADVAVDGNDASADAPGDVSIDGANDGAHTDDASAEAETGPAADASSDADAGPIDGAPLDSGAEAEAAPPALPCPASVALPLGKPIATGSTVNRSDTTRGTCVSGIGNDIAFDWVAPYSDWYSINTTGSTFDTVLYLRDGTCSGTELACNDNANGGAQSEILYQFTENQRVAIYVDGRANDKGNVVVNAERITCPGGDLTGLSFPQTALTTAGYPDSHVGACGKVTYPAHPDRAFRYTPPTAGLYKFTATSTAFQPMIFVEQGPRCGGTLLGCNTELVLGGSYRYPAEVIRKLPAGEPVTIIVDGADGSGFFDLNVVRVDDGSTCGVAALPTVNVSTTLAAAGANRQTASCAPAGMNDGFGGPTPSVDDTYAFTVNLGASCGQFITFTSNGLFTAYLVRGQCAGPEVRCEAATLQGDGSYSLTMSFGSADNGTYTLVLERAGWQTTTIKYSGAGIC
jgi:hypothetical protein